MAMTFFWFICLTEMSGERSGRFPSQRSVSTKMSARNISQPSSYTDNRQKLIWCAFQLLQQIEVFLLVPRSVLILSQTQHTMRFTFYSHYAFYTCNFKQNDTIKSISTSNVRAALVDYLLIHSRIYGLRKNVVSKTSFMAWMADWLENNQMEIKWPWPVWRQYPVISLGGLRKNTRSFSYVTSARSKINE